MATTAQPESTTLRHLRWNFPLFLFDFVVFGISMNLLSPNSVVPEFINRLTDDARIIGLAGTLATFCVNAPQLFFSQLISRRTRRKPFLFASIPFRLLIPLMAMIIAVIGNTNPTLILITFLVCYALFWVGDALITIVWADMTGSALTPKARATIFGMGQFAVALGAIGAREIVRRLLAPEAPAFPTNYVWLFGIAGICFVAAGVALSSVREEEQITPMEPGPTLRQFVPFIFKVLREDSRFRYFTIARLALDFVSVAVPFYVIFGTDILKVESSQLVGDSILLMTIGNATISLLNTQISRRFGPRAVMWLVAACTLSMTIAALFSVSTGSVTGLHICYVLLGAISGSFASGVFDYVITYATPDRRPIYIGLTNTISAIGNAAPLIGGFILNATHSYPVLFGVSLAIALIGAVLSLGLADPRKQHSQLESSTNVTPTA
ncbi:MAG: MFS transporter [Anaerolineae bacterium]|nr:MFS transporter [Anaerolineae bacterium]